MKSSIDYLKEAGLAARHYVRGALDPDLTEWEQVNQYVGSILKGEDSETARLTGVERAQIAGEVLTGWEAHRPDGRAADRLLWLRFMSGVVLEVRSPA